MEALKLNGNLNLEIYLYWIQSMERIFELKGYNGDKSFKLAILKMKGNAFFWCKDLKNNKVREAKLRLKTWYKALEAHGEEILIILTPIAALPRYYLP